MQLIVKHAIAKVPGMKTKIVKGIEKPNFSDGHIIDEFINKLGILTAHVFSTRIVNKKDISFQAFFKNKYWADLLLF